ncbi:MAG: toxin-antitoxin system HicB family antitoxin [Patescibacteria group bacterium]
MGKINPADYGYYVSNIGEKNDPAYMAIIPKFPKLHAFGDTLEELNDGVIAGIELELECLEKEGKTPPPPDKKSNFNGKILLRISPEIHSKLHYEAQAHDLSLNKYIESKLQ